MKISRLVYFIVVFISLLIILPTILVTAQSFELTIKVAKLNVRTGPSTKYTIVGQLVRDDIVTAIGRSKDRKWFVIEYPAAQGGQGWINNVRSNFSSVGGNIATLSEIVAPPLPSKSSKPTATPVVESLSPQPSSGGGGSCPDVSATCSQLSSCSEARACLAAGNTSLDRDHDGIPCESLCS